MGGCQFMGQTVMELTEPCEPALCCRKGRLMAALSLVRWRFRVNALNARHIIMPSGLDGRISYLFTYVDVQKDQTEKSHTQLRSSCYFSIITADQQTGGPLPQQTKLPCKQNNEISLHIFQRWLGSGRLGLASARAKHLKASPQMYQKKLRKCRLFVVLAGRCAYLQRHALGPTLLFLLLLLMMIMALCIPVG